MSKWTFLVKKRGFNQLLDAFVIMVQNQR